MNEWNRMRLDGLNKWLTLVANIGVLLGIIFLVIETRLNTTEMQRNISMDQLQRSSELRLTIAPSRDLAELIVSGNREISELDEADYLRYNIIIRDYFFKSFVDWELNKTGNASALTWEVGWGRWMTSSLGTNGGAELWRSEKSQFPIEYQEDVERLSEK